MGPYNPASSGCVCINASGGGGEGGGEAPALGPIIKYARGEGGGGGGGLLFSWAQQGLS